MKRSIRNIFYTLFCIFFIFAFSVNSVFSYWNIAHDIISSETTPTKTNEPVCYTKSDNKQYTSIEKALEKANSGETVYVIPGTKPTISRNCVIKENVTLCLPYDGTTYFNSEVHGTNNVFSDASESSINTNRVTQVIIKENVKITMKTGSNLNIGGIVAGPGQGLAGQTAGKYCEILMKNGSQIISNGGNINCFGYIKEDVNNTCFISVENATVVVPFVIHDFKGGSATLGIENRTTDKFCPFEIFDFPNIQSKIRIYSSSFLKSYCQIYISSTKTYFPTNEPDRYLTVIGNTTSNTIFILKNGYIDMKHTPDESGISKTFSATDKTTDIFEIYGSCSIGSISISISVLTKTVTVYTANFFLPLCYRYKIYLKDNSALNVDKNIKFMNGSEVTVDAGSKITLNNSKIIFYESDYMKKENDVYTYNKESINKYPTIASPAQLINNGTIEVDNSSAIGGFIQTNKNTGSIIYNSKITRVESPESNGVHPSSTAAIGGTETGVVHYPLSCHILFNSSDNDVTIDVNNSPYKSEGSYWIKDTNSILANIDKPSGSSGANAASSYQLQGSLVSSDPSVTAKEYRWNITENIDYGYFGTNETTKSYVGQSVTLNTKANSNTDGDIIVRIELVITASNGETYTTAGAYTCTKKESSGGGGSTCLLPDTKVTLYDGSIKLAKDLTPNDELLSYNHFTGNFEKQKLIANVFYDEKLYDVITLRFSNGNIMKVATGHGLFNATNGRYEIYYGNEFIDHIGEEFIAVNSNGQNHSLEKTTLISVDVTKERVVKLTPVTEYNINCIADGMLNIPDDIEGFFDAFEYQDLSNNLKINQDSFINYVNQYGVYEYEDVQNVIPEYLFNVLNFKYFKVFIGMGVLSYDKVNYWIDMYAKQMCDYHNIPWDWDNREQLSPSN